jgi:SAM-dependent methyltransferase
MTDSDANAPDAAYYDGFADVYRTWWAPIIAPAARGLLDRLGEAIPAGDSPTIVDVGTGTGTVAIEALRRWAHARVIGIDPASRLLEFARAEAEAAGLQHRLTTRVGEADRLPLPDASADAVTCTFVLQLLADRAGAVREAHRALRPGGVYATLTWRSDEDPFEPEQILGDVLEDLGITPPERPDGIGESYASAHEAADEMRTAGFRSVDAREVWLEHRFTAQTYLEVAEHWTEDDVFAALDDATRDRVRSELLRRVEQLTPEQLAWRRPLVSVIGRRQS